MILKNAGGFVRHATMTEVHHNVSLPATLAGFIDNTATVQYVYVLVNSF